MQIGIRKETDALETRVAVTPEGVGKLLKLGFSVAIEQGAGEGCGFSDQAYLDAGASVIDHEGLLASDMIFAVNPVPLTDINRMNPGATLVSFIQPAVHKDLVEACQKRNITALAMDMVPRISRAQSMDALSSLANIAGYRAVVEAAAQFGRFLNGQITAAGKIAPAKLLVIGAGVAGLAAIGTAKSLGAQVRAFDARPEVKEQVESMGAKFLVINHEEKQAVNDGYTRSTSEEFDRKAAELYAQQAKEVDIIITTANIPGRRAPLLLTEQMVYSMKPGSIIVDLAAVSGGNCALTQPDKVVTTPNNVKIIGCTNFYAMLGTQASTLYSNNLVNLSKLLCPANDGHIELNLEDVIVRNMIVTKAVAVNQDQVTQSKERYEALEKEAHELQKAYHKAEQAFKLEQELGEAKTASAHELLTGESDNKELGALKAKAKQAKKTFEEFKVVKPEFNLQTPATLLYPPPAISVSAAPKATEQKTEVEEKRPTTLAEKLCAKAKEFFSNKLVQAIIAVVVVFGFLRLFDGLPADFLNSLHMFVIASVLGYFIIWNVHSALHTPLMSLTNALSGIVIIGAMLQIDAQSGAASILAYLAIFIAGLNVFGGFAVTHRMLAMFIKKDKKDPSSPDQGGK